MIKNLTAGSPVQNDTNTFSQGRRTKLKISPIPLPAHYFPTPFTQVIDEQQLCD